MTTQDQPPESPTGERASHPEAERYPSLKGMDVELADKWLHACHREAALHLPGWARAIRWVWLASAGACVVSLALAAIGARPRLWVGFEVALLAALLMSGLWAVVYERYIERAVERRMREETEAGRLRFCLGCDFDLRGTQGDRCPECGARTTLGVR